MTDESSIPVLLLRDPNVEYDDNNETDERSESSESVEDIDIDNNNLTEKGY